ncbi:MAG: chorismate mutase [Saprospiraceae bacterium]|nr:chorismate mutase [Saprospiraceae bacterium]
MTARGDLDAIISLRAKIDNIDRSLMKLVAERMKIAEQIGIIKKSLQYLFYKQTVGRKF